MTSWTHVLAVVVGAARPGGDVHAHFSSLLGFDDHLAVARQLGLVVSASDSVDDDEPEVLLTDAGRAFFEQFQLAGLPEGRANYWNLRHVSVTEPAADELARRWEPLRTQRPANQDGTP